MYTGCKARRGGTFVKQPVFTGSGVAIITPFTNDGVDYTALADLLEFQLQNGTDAIIVCGTTGEAATMSPMELSLIHI